MLGAHQSHSSQMSTGMLSIADSTADGRPVMAVNTTSRESPMRRGPSSFSPCSPTSKTPLPSHVPSSSSSSSARASGTSMSLPPRDYSFPSTQSPSSSRPQSPGSINRTRDLGSDSQPHHGQARSRRTSSLVHEIQPPSRRLSAHQMLLLTPFGGIVPTGTSPGVVGVVPQSASAALAGGAGMGRTSSSMGRASSSMGRTGSAMGRSSGSGPSMSRERTSMISSMTSITPNAAQTAPPPPPPTSSTWMSRMESSAGPSMPRHHPSGRSRYHSLQNVPGQSPLAASAPMTTIPSASEHGSSSEGQSGSVPSSRDASQSKEDEGGDHLADLPMPDLMGGMPVTVPMTRSNSLPVLTLRELQALRQKDGELGIARGGEWAWVSRGSYDGEEEDEDDDGEYANREESHDPREHDMSSVSSVSVLSSASSKSSPGRHAISPFTAFNDPFASSHAEPSTFDTGPSVVRDRGRGSGETVNGTSPSTKSQPFATTAGYHYSPTYNDTRRMSDALSFLSPSTGRQALDSGRRPSAPVQPTASDRSSTSTTASSHETKGGSSKPETTTPSRPSLRLDEDGSVARPRLTRYKSMPGRQQGLGLSIVVRPNQSTSGPSTAQPHGAANSSAEASRRGSEHLGAKAGGEGVSPHQERRTSAASSIDKNGKPVAGSAGSGKKRVRKARGSWAAVDLIDSLHGDLEFDQTISPLSSTRGSIQSTRTGGGSDGSIQSEPFNLSVRTAPPASRSSLPSEGSSPRGKRGGSTSRSSLFNPAVPTTQSQHQPQALHQAPVYLVEEISTRAHLATFGLAGENGKPKEPAGRGRFESIDSCLPLYRLPRTQLPSTGQTTASGEDAPLVNEHGMLFANGGLGGGVFGESWNATFPRRGSLAVVNKTIGLGVTENTLYPWSAGVTSGTGGAGAVPAGGGASVGGAGKMPHWSERRGSWAEGWSKN